MFRHGWSSAAAIFLAPLWLAAPGLASPIPSKALAPGVSAVAPVEATVEQLLARDEVARALAAHGLSASDVEGRLAQLTPHELQALAANVDQIHAAGTVPQYIWILLAILIGVTILATVF